MSEGELSPAMRRWVDLLARGYSIRPVIARSSYRETVWRPGLFNPEGMFVQRIRIDTARRLEALGLLEVRDDRSDDGGSGTGGERGELGVSAG